VELLADVGRARVALVLRDEDLMRLDVAHFLLLQLDVVVSAALVDDFDMRVLVTHDLILDGALVAVSGLVSDVAVDKRVLREDFAHEELLGEGERLDIVGGDVDELGLRVVAEVVVAEERVRADLVRDLIRQLVQGLLVRVETDSNRAV